MYNWQCTVCDRIVTSNMVPKSLTCLNCAIRSWKPEWINFSVLTSSNESSATSEKQTASTDYSKTYADSDVNSAKTTIVIKGNIDATHVDDLIEERSNLSVRELKPKSLVLDLKVNRDQEENQLTTHPPSPITESEQH